MKYSDIRPGKGFLKNYNYWLNDHLYDFYQSCQPKDPLKNVNIDLLENFSQMVTINGRIRRIYTKPAVEKEKRVKVRKSFDGLLFFKTIFDQGAMSSWLMYLTAKDIFALVGTSKGMSRLLDCKEVWRSFMNRDFDHPSNRVLEEKQISLKHLYKYKLISSRIGILYNTGSFLEKSMGYEATLARTMIDFTAVTSIQIKSLLSCERVDNGLINDLKLSWNKQKNKIILWFSGYSVTKSKTSVYTTNNPIAHAIQTYKFPKTSSIGNAWFHQDKFLVIEVDSIETLECRESNHIIRKKELHLYDLSTEIEYAVTGMGKTKPVTFSFCKKLENSPEVTFGPFAEHTNEPDTTIWIDQNGEDEKDELTIQAKFIQNDQILFFSKQRKNATLIISSLNDVKKRLQIVLSPKAPILDIFEPKLAKQANNNILFLIDEYANLYKISYAVDDLLEFVNINTKNDQIKGPGPRFERFPETIRRYYQGIYNCVGEGQEIEYLMLLRNGSHFEIINTESLEIHRFYLPKTIEGDYVSDWSVLEDKLLIVTNEEMGVWKFSFPNFKIEQVIDSVGTQWRNLMYHKQWIRADPCFTVMISSHGESFYALDKMEILINPTQVILGGVSENLTKGFLTDITDILLRPSNIEYPFKLIPQNVHIKYQNGKLLIVTSNYSFFCDLNITIGHAGGLALSYIQGRWIPTQEIDIRKVVNPSHSMKIKTNETVANVSEKLLDYKPIPINKNQKKEKVNWSHCPKKDYWKPYREENLLVRRKGYKYVKNLREEERSKKYEEMPNQLNDNSETDQDFSSNLQEYIFESYD